MNISSVLVYTRPQDLQLVREHLSTLTGVEVHAASENGRLIVIIEADSVQAVADIFAQINQQPCVFAASMVYHQFEPDPDEEA